MIKKLCLLSLLLPLLISAASGLIVYNGSDPRYLALTFDDGPTPGITERILEILKQENVQATFFVIGEKAQKTPQILSSIWEGGNDIGNHTYFHSRLDWINDGKLLDELRSTSKIISGISGKPSCLFRPPHGELPRSKIKLLTESGYKIVLWSVNADDFFHAKRGMRSADSIVRRVVSRVKGGDVILMHDDSREIVEALPKIIKVLKEKGYSLVTVSKLLNSHI